MSLIQVKRHSDGKIFTSNMGVEENNSILSMHFCTSYTQVEVQERTKEEKYKVTYIICPPLGSTPNPIDLIAAQDDETGEII